MRGQQIVQYVSELGQLAQVTSLFTAGEFLLRTALNAGQVVNTGRLTAADTSMASDFYDWAVQGVELRVPRQYFGGAREMYARNVYFGVPGFDLTAEDVVLDLGANTGLFTLLAAVKCQRVVCVEAQEGFARDIRSLLELHGVEEKAAIQLGLIGAGTGLFADGGDEVEYFGGKSEEISIDDLLKQHGLDRVDFLKCDIEGSEFELIQTGEEEWLQRVRRIAMEVHTPHGDHEALASALTRSGFRVLSFDDRLNPLKFPVTDPATYLFATRG